MPLLKAGEATGHLLNSAGPRAAGSVVCVQGLLCDMDSGIAVLMSPIIKTNYKDRMRSPAPKPGSRMGTLGQK